MLLLHVTVACVLFGGSSSDVTLKKEKCYGSSLTLPFEFSPPLLNGPLYFIPSSGGSRMLVMDKGKAKHPRLKVEIGSVQFTDLTERDEGTFSIPRNNGRRQNDVKLTIIDCATRVMQYYGDIFSRDLPRQAEFLEFTPLHNVDESKVLWNRTDPQTNNGGRVRIKRNVWEIKNLNQADMGHYNLRAKTNTLMSRILLEVKEKHINYNPTVNGRLLIQNPPGVSPWTVAFSPEGENENQILMDAGNLLTENDYSLPFAGRMLAMHNGIEIEPVKSIDSGTFEFRDPQGNLAQAVHLLVNPEPASTIVYVGIIVGIIFAVILCCCCVRKCCCKKSSSKRAESAPQTAATPAVYYHDTSQREGPGYSAVPVLDHSTHYSMNSLVSRERTTISLEPLGYNPLNIDVNPPPPQVAPLGGHGFNPAPLLGSGWLSSDPESTFELKGISSAPPLSSGSTFCDVYTSDKLNFL